MKASDLFVRALEAEGVEYVFGVPGEENLDLLESLRESGIQLVVTRHEQAAGFMAATYGRLTGRAGVCLSTLGPGATNLVTAAAYAQLAAMPMVMLTGQKPIKSSKQGRFQIIDVVDMMRPITKFTAQVVSGDRVPSIVREAFRLAQEERPGATHIELPEDIAAEDSAAQLLAASETRRPCADQKSIERAVSMIQASRAPLLLVGAAANRKLTATMLREFVDETGIPFVATQMGKGVIDEAGERYLGTAALSDGGPAHEAIEQADLIINVGHDVIEKPPFFMSEGGVPVIHVNFESAAVDPVYFPQLEVVGDIANSIWQIRQALRPLDSWRSWGPRGQGGDDLDALPETRDRFPMHLRQVVADLRSAIPADGIVSLDNGMFKLWFARHYTTHQPNTLLLDNALATMGAGLPSAIAACLVHPQRPVVAVCGDGGFMMNSQELETATRLGLHIVVIVLRDDAYGMIRWKQVGMELEDYGLGFGNPDFVRYAESYGARGWRVQSAAGFLPRVRECLRTPAVHLVDVPIEYNHQDQALTGTLPPA